MISYAEYSHSIDPFINSEPFQNAMEQWPCARPYPFLRRWTSLERLGVGVLIIKFSAADTFDRAKSYFKSHRFGLKIL